MFSTSPLINRYILLYTLLFTAALFAISACKTTHQRVMESDDYGKKMEYAYKYMEEGSYGRAKPVLNDLIQFYRGTEQVIEFYFMYAEAHYETGEYLIASHYYKTLAQTFPNSEFAEESMFKHAYSLYHMSPRPSLDQTQTRRALQGFQLFVNQYPDSEYVDRSHRYMDELRHKLEIKAINNAKLYYRIGDYRAAVWALENVLQRYPATDRREELEFMILEASYKLASRSVADMRPERYRETIEYFNRFNERFPESPRMDNAREMYESANAYFEN